MSKIQASVGTSQKSATREAVAEAVARARAGGVTGPSAAVVTWTVEHAAEAVHDAARAELPGVALHGISTSLGVLTSGGVVSSAEGAVGVMLLAAAPGAALAVGSAELGADPRAAGRAAARAVAAVAQGAPCRALFLGASPGSEEDVLEGVAQAIPGASVWGGSAADHAIAGEWRVLTENGPRAAAVSLLGFFGDVRAGGAILAPYAPTDHRAEVTACDDRLLGALDGKPAAEVLDGWLGGAIDFQVKNGGNILAQTALAPIGVQRGDGHYVTIHPAHVRAPGGAVDLFARLRPGDVVCSMRGDVDGLVGALPRLVERALAAGGLAVADVRAALLIYCAGCAGAVGARLDGGLKQHLGAALPGVPLLGLCTFGEQGHVPGAGNVHQDLSLSLLLVG